MDERKEDSEKPSSSAGGTEPLFQIKRWNAVASWQWDATVDICAICRICVTNPCIQCQANGKLGGPEECSPAWGACSHVFHMHCIERWIRRKNVCPLDNKGWVFQNIGN